MELSSSQLFQPFSENPRTGSLVLHPPAFCLLRVATLLVSYVSPSSPETLFCLRCKQKTNLKMSVCFVVLLGEPPLQGSLWLA